MLLFSSCKTDDTSEAYVEPENIETQNAYDDEAIQKFLSDNYLDNLGNIKSYSSTTTADDNYPSLATLPKTKLNSGVIYIAREGAQPAPGTAIGSTDIIRFMNRTYTYVAVNTDNNVNFTSTALFRSTIDGAGVPEVDPSYYYVKKSVLTADTSKDRNYYEIEGLKEALQNFKAFDMQDGDNYNLQGVIIVPSRAAFARDAHYNYTGYSLRNRSFVFNFQVYKTSVRPVEQ